MSFLRSLALAFVIFSRVPMPHTEWSEKNMRYLMAALPFVGAVISLGVAAWWLLCDACALGQLARSAGLVLIPLALTGAIHMDGFCDVVDALSSCADAARKREILKDSHVGAFAVMGAASYILAQTTVFSELNTSYESLALLAVMFVLSRVVTGLTTLRIPHCSEEGMGASFQKAQGKGNTAALGVMLLACAGGAVLAGGLAGAAMVAAALACTAYVAVMAKREFGGMSGDLAGFLLQLCELAMPLCVVVAQKVMVML